MLGHGLYLVKWVWPIFTFLMVGLYSLAMIKIVCLYLLISEVILILITVPCFVWGNWYLKFTTSPHIYSHTV